MRYEIVLHLFRTWIQVSPSGMAFVLCIDIKCFTHNSRSEMFKVLLLHLLIQPTLSPLHLFSKGECLWHGVYMLFFLHLVGDTPSCSENTFEK